ncbi:hypothetical protein GCM10007103_22120 [Salinimicrobium marinum]|uniref:Por secretion system C-terminal sorting domain-containing protein n=1 Tax=Salinimicrobium marinum TaxID=680283 RepID=A0A918SGS3_9FLAO|nr:YCF48-related protein [Salinimicrobium marinum]GHA40243.1 hypothetical protein GCM10007103_22120 [Salinimicrobium marinum]
MARILPIIFIFLITFTSYAQNNWELLNPTPSPETGKDVLFVSTSKGFIITAKELLITEDAGVTWTKKMELQGAADIDFLENTGFIVGTGGYVVTSKNGGETWTRVSTGSSDNFNSVQIIENKTIILSGTKTIVRSDDGGATWKSHNIGGNYAITKTFFTGALTGHAVCKGGFILKTVDGGQNWKITEKTSIYPNDFFTVYFVNEKVGFATKQHSTILKTIDGGETWKETRNTTDAFYSLFFLDEKTGFATGDNGVIFKTSDGGDTWEWISFQNGRYDQTSMFGIYFHNSTEGYVVGQRGRILKTKDGGSSWDQYSPFYDDVSEFQLITSDIAYASIWSKLFKTRDGGKTWQDMGSPVEGVGLSKFEFLNENIGYAIVGNSNYYYAVYKTTNGGQSWVQTNSGEDIMRDNLYSMDFIDEKTGFVSGGYNQKGVFKTTNGGNSWIIVEGNSFGEMQFIDEKTGYAREVGYYGKRIYKTTDAGENWEEIFETEESLTSMYFVDKKIGYLAGERGVIYKTTDGGLSWRKLEVPYQDYMQIKFYSANVGYTVDDDGGLWKTINGGSSWQKNAAFYKMNSIDISDDKQIYLSGTHGKILKSKVSFDPFSLLAGPAEEISNNSAWLIGNASANVGNIKNIQFEYGTNNNFDKIISTSVLVAENESATLAVEANDLLPATKYQYRIRGTVGNSNVYSQIMEFTTKADYELNLYSPYVEVMNSVTFSADIIANKAEISKIEFQYGTEDNPFAESISASPVSVSPNNPRNVQAKVNELEADTKYQVRIKAIHEGKVIYSHVREFKTQAEYRINLHAPHITDNNVSLSANVTAYLEDLENLAFEYGTREFENEIAATPDVVSIWYSEFVSSTLTDLNPEQTYYFRLRGTMGKKIVYSSIGVFNTSKESIVVPDGAQMKEDHTVIAKGLINPGGKYLTNIRFEYGENDKFNMSVSSNPSEISGNTTTSVKATLLNLAPGSSYSYRIKAVEGQKEIISEEFKFVTEEGVQLSQDILSMQVTDETCTGKNNGALIITAEEEHNFTATINGEEYNFTSQLKLENLSPGQYTACITAAAAPEFYQCFEFTISGGISLIGNAQVKRNAVGHSTHIHMEEGTAPFFVSINGSVVGEYDSPDFSVNVRQGDKLEIASQAACEGKLILEVDLDESLTAYPNPASSFLHILIPYSEEKTTQVDIYNNSGSLMSSKEYSISNNVVSLPLEDLVSGIYFAVVRLHSPKTIKFSKK